MKRRRFITGLGATAAAGLLPGCGRGAGDGLLTATDVHVSDYPTVQAVRWIGETLEKQTDGRLRIRLFHSGQLGREAEAIDMARFGVIDFTRVYSGALNNAFPLTRALCLPYVFDSVAHMRAAMDGGIGQDVLDGFAARGLVGLAIYDSGARNFYNARRPIVTPADMHGMKIRVPLSDIFIRLLRLFGANATPLSLGEVYSGMETHMIDGAENNIRSFHSSRHFEAARYWSRSEHSYAPDVLMLSQRTWDALSPADRDLVRDAARASVGVMRQAWDESEARAREEVFAAGVEANDVDMAAFRRAAAPLLEEHRADTRIDALYRRIRDIA